MTKKILFILLLVSNFSFGQITINEIAGGGNNTCSPTGIVQVTLSARDFTVDRLYIAVIFSDSSTSFGTLTATAGADWDTVSQIGNSTRKIAVYKTMPTSSITSNTKIEFSFGSYPNAVFFHIYEITGVQIGNNGANAIKQVVIDSATGTDPTITMATLGQRNAVLSFFSNSIIPFSGTPESGWNEQLDVGCETYVGSAYTNGMYAMDRINTSDNTPTVTCASSTWIGAAIELRQSGRRLTLID